MSGVFVDGGGGGQNHGGHVAHGGHGGDGFTSFGDGGNHHNHSVHGADGMMDGGSQHHGMHGSQGSSGIGSLFGINSNHQHNFVAHLLGLDHDMHGGHGHGMAGGTPMSTSMPFWSVALQSMTLSNILKGVALSTNGWWLVLFTGFTTWLVIVSWVRHHETTANKVIGTTGAYHAVPNKPTPLPGITSLYPRHGMSQFSATPLAPAIQPAVPIQPAASVPTAMITPSAGSAGAATRPVFAPMTVSPSFAAHTGAVPSPPIGSGTPSNDPIVLSTVRVTRPVNDDVLRATAAAPVRPEAATTRPFSPVATSSATHVAIHDVTGSRLRTIVDR